VEYETILVARADGVATITLNRPERLNAYTHQMGKELVDAWKRLDEDPEVRVIVMTGAGRAFCAGADVKEFQQAVQGRGPGVGRERLVASPLQSTPMVVRNLVKPIIAAINGPAVGVGLTIALACDIRIASEEARLGAIFAQMGLIPEFGSTYNLTRLVGIAKACELVFTAKIVDAAEAKEIGMVNQVVPASALTDATAELANRIAQFPPVAIQLAKRLLYQGLDNDLPSQVQLETLGLALCFQTEDHAEAVKAFLEKRPPQFRGK
jgi:2-(1,2-epoxy-1,2-dihydrophenyl)acetyl-CoA isomerase